MHKNAQLLNNIMFLRCFYRYTVEAGAADLIFANYIKMRFLKCVQSKLYSSKKLPFGDFCVAIWNHLYGKMLYFGPPKR